MYYEDNHISLFDKDCRSMAELPDESVQMVCCSPPYWGLTKYSGEQELIWGDSDCEHEWGNTIPNPMAKSGKHGPASTIGAKVAQHEVRQDSNQGSFCSLCGAWKGAYGLEPTPEMYVQHTIEILREIRRVLRKDGVVFWNIGDSYWGGKGQSSYAWSLAHPDRETFQKPYHHPSGKGETRPTDGKHGIIKPKDLCLIPFRLAIAAQEDGWWVRSVIIWNKPNPMPESVRDRPTESHEYILMLTKSKKYYWDADAVREPHKPEAADRYQYGYKESERDKLGHSHHGKGYQRNDGSPIELNAGRNIRTVWEFPTQPFKEAHFAVFPEKLPEICIKAATPEVGCCSKCGAPWTRVLEKGFTDHGGKTETHYPQGTTANRLAKLRQAAREQGNEYRNEQKTLAWQPTCKCEGATPLPSLVLDPFAGAGTTLLVAKRLNRRAVGYEISEEYCELTGNRCRQQVLV